MPNREALKEDSFLNIGTFEQYKAIMAAIEKGQKKAPENKLLGYEYGKESDMPGDWSGMSQAFHQIILPRGKTYDIIHFSMPWVPISETVPVPETPNLIHQVEAFDDKVYNLEQRQKVFLTGVVKTAKALNLEVIIRVRSIRDKKNGNVDKTLDTPCFEIYFFRNQPSAAESLDTEGIAGVRGNSAKILEK